MQAGNPFDFEYPSWKNKMNDTMTLYVSPDGNDAWSGRLPDPSADGRDGPLATPARARDLLRELPKSEAGARRVLLRGGVYRLSEPLVFGPEDSGTETCPVVFGACPGERPVLSGGREISGWTLDDVNGRDCWVAELPEVRAGTWNFTQLFVNGRRCPRPRWPKRGYHRFTEWKAEAPDCAEFAEGDLQAWRNLDDVRLITLQYWEENHLRIRALDPAKREVRFVTGCERKPIDEQGRFARYYAENVFEALTEPGEWYLDRPEGRLFYLPLEGETPEAVEVVAPVLRELVRFAGTEDQPVRHIVLENLSLQHAEWSYPPGRTASIQAAVLAPGAVCMDFAEECVLYGCEITRVAQYGVEMRDGCSGNRVAACALHDLGAGGVRIGKTEHPDEETKVRGRVVGGKPMHATVCDCEIHDGGRIFPSAIGVWIGDCGFNRVMHNHIHHFRYTGISSGWTWGYAPTRTVDNRIEFNHIHHINWERLLSDNGGIYTLGRHPGSVVRGNVIHHVGMYFYGGRGLYPDEGTTGLLLENNLVYRCDGPGYRTHFGRDNHARNNILAHCGSPQVVLGNKEEGRAAIFERNLVFWEDAYLEIDGTPGYALYRDNLFWGGTPDCDMGWGMCLADWQELGQHGNTRMADPLFADPDGEDFTLRSDSPALALGFEPIDPNRAGPRTRATRPAHYRDWTPPPEAEKEILSTELTLTEDRVTVHLRNEGRIPAGGRLRLRAEPPGRIAFDADPLLDTGGIPPGETRAFEFAFRILDPGPFWIETLPETPSLFPTLVNAAVEDDASCWEVPRLPEVTDIDELPALLSDQRPRIVRTFKKEVAEVRLAVAGSCLALDVLVRDAQMQRGSPLWKGSCIQIFASRPEERLPDLHARNPGLLRHVFLAPCVGGKPDCGALLRNQRHEILDTVCLRSRPRPEGYSLSALVPLELLKIPVESEAFLLEIMVDIPRPADPDGKGDHYALFGSAAASANNRNYGTVVPVKNLNLGVS